MRLFFDPHITPSTDSHTLSEEESKHIVRVLRMQIGDELVILDGRGGEYICAVTDTNPKRCSVNILNRQQHIEPKHNIHIAVSPTKQMDRMEWFVEKATEIGINELTFLNCQNSERVKLKLDRLEKKAISAMKQSHRKFLPKLNELTKFDDFITGNPNGLIAHCYEGTKESIGSVFQAENCPILIGPEGDFTMEEVKKAHDNGYKLITLGENRLRTETAALYSCMQAKLMVQ